MENSKKENQAFVIALLTICGGFASFYFFPAKDAIVIPLMTFVLGYYFGSSPGSHGKDQTIGDLAKAAIKGSNGNGNGYTLKKPPCDGSVTTHVDSTTTVSSDETK
jgi:hypothetical protein